MIFVIAIVIVFYVYINISYLFMCVRMCICRNVVKQVSLKMKYTYYKVPESTRSIPMHMA